jgi:hypothetical protein
MSGEVVSGLPSGVFLPVGNYKFKYLTDLAAATLPIRGQYPEGLGMDGGYDICPEPGVIMFSTLTQVLLAFGKYPNLTGNQRFVMAGLELDGDNIRIIGKVVELLEE